MHNRAASCYSTNKLFRITLKKITLVWHEEPKYTGAVQVITEVNSKLFFISYAVEGWYNSGMLCYINNIIRDPQFEWLFFDDKKVSC